MRIHKTLVKVGLLIALGATLGAEQRGTVILAPPLPSGLSPRLSFAAPWRPAGSGYTRVVGSVIDSRQVPVAKIKVGLRNIGTGEVMAELVSDANGEYSFLEVEPGTYFVEAVAMIIDGRYIVVLSNAGAVGRSETLQTTVQLQGRWDLARQAVVVPRIAFNFVGLSAATTMAGATMAAATTESITPTAPGVQLSPSQTSVK